MWEAQAALGLAMAAWGDLPPGGRDVVPAGAGFAVGFFAVVAGEEPGVGSAGSGGLGSG